MIFSDMVEQVMEMSDIIREDPTPDMYLEDIDIEYELNRITHDDYHLLPIPPQGGSDATGCTVERDRIV